MKIENGREIGLWESVTLAMIELNLGTKGVSEAQLGLLQVTEGLVENNGKANLTDISYNLCQIYMLVA